MKTYKTYNPPGSTQTTKAVRKFDLKVIWDWEDGSLIRCEIPEEVMQWDWIEASDFFKHLQGWAETQLEGIQHQLKSVDKPFERKHFITLKEIKFNSKGWGQKGIDNGRSSEV